MKKQPDIPIKDGIYQQETIFSSLLYLPTIKQMTDSLIDEAIARAPDFSEAACILGISYQSLCKLKPNRNDSNESNDPP